MSGCWLWDGAIGQMGYGIFMVADLSVKSKQRRLIAHRASYACHVGDVAEGVKVCHRCDVPLCINPDHLFLGTQADNLADCRQKGRAVPPPHLRGEDRSTAKLKNADIVSIREGYASGVTLTDLSRRFNVSRTHVKNIVVRKKWGHIQ